MYLEMLYLETLYLEPLYRVLTVLFCAIAVGKAMLAEFKLLGAALSIGVKLGADEFSAGIEKGLGLVELDSAISAGSDSTTPCVAMDLELLTAISPDEIVPDDRPTATSDGSGALDSSREAAVKIVPGTGIEGAVSAAADNTPAPMTKAVILTMPESCWAKRATFTFIV